MAATINGLHHVTAISSDAQASVAFYTRMLGLRLVKKTVNFDEPDVYHLYYGNPTGAPGTVLTIFPFEHARRGRRGAGEASIVQYAVPQGSLPFWRARLDAAGVPVAGPKTVFGEARLVFEDPAGMKGALVEAPHDLRTPWMTTDVGEEVAIRGLHGVTLTLDDPTSTADLLTGILDYELAGREGGVQRFTSRHARTAHLVEVEQLGGGQWARQGAGSVHHVAFRVVDRATQAEVRRRLLGAGIPTTPVIDRTYFDAIYFRSPGGVLFEVATETPGFTVDEPLAELGRSLKLPPRHERLRASLEATLPPLTDAA